MAWHDRDYNREEQPTSSRLGGTLTGQSVVTWLLVINVVVFILDRVLTGSSRANAFSPFEWGYFSVQKVFLEGQAWRLVTSLFLHGDFFHIFFNMLTLYYFGPMVEQWWGSRRFIAFYLISGLGADVVFTVLSLIPELLSASIHSPCIGASGCIFGVLVAAAVIAPRQRVMLMFPPVPIQLRTLVYFFLGLAVLSVLAGSVNSGGEAAHLGGAAMGFLLIRNPRLLGFTSFFAKENRLFRQQQRYQRQREDERKALAALDAEVDRILAKVKDQGLHSLTDKEKKTLATATDRQRKAG